MSRSRINPELMLSAQTRGCGALMVASFCVGYLIVDSLSMRCFDSERDTDIIYELSELQYMPFSAGDYIEVVKEIKLDRCEMNEIPR